jgi:uncharacterized protein
MDKNIITIEGNGHLRIQPDLAVITCEVSAVNRSYTEANREMNRRTELLRQALADVGLEKTDLKTLNYAVTRHTEHDPKTHVQNFVGYNAHHSLGLRLPLDKERLNVVMEALLVSAADAQVNVSFTMADQEATRTRLLTTAVANARQRAEVIAQAAGVRLGKITNIMKHGVTEMRVLHTSYFYDPGTPNMEASSLAVSDSVTVTWELLQ